MNDEDLDGKLKAEMSQANAMQAALNHGLQEFFNNKNEQLFTAFKDTPAGDTKTLEGLHYACMAVKALETEVNGILDTGKLAAAQLAQAETK